MDELIGRKAYLKRGFFAGITGIIQKSDNGFMHGYSLVFKDGSGYWFNDVRSITLIDGDDD